MSPASQGNMSSAICMQNFQMFTMISKMNKLLHSILTECDSSKRVFLVLYMTPYQQ